MKKIVVLTFVALLFALTSYAPAQGPTPRADFVITCAQKVLSAPPGTTVMFQLSLTPVNGFQGTASFACVAGTPGVTCNAPAGTVQLGPDLNVPFEVAARTGADVGPGTYPMVVTVKGISVTATVTHSETLYVTTISKTP